MENKATPHSLPRLIASSALGCLVGFVLIAVPFLTQYMYPGSFPKLVYGALQHTTFASVLLLFVGGVVFGLIFGVWHALVASVSQVASLPAAAIVEMAEDPTSHNLWPIEFVQYAFLAIVPLAGTFLGLKIRRHFLSTPGPESQQPQ